MTSILNLLQVTQQVLGSRDKRHTLEDLGVWTAPHPPVPQPRPSFTSVGGGGSEGRGGCGESSRLPEVQPGHRLDDHGRDSQDAGERAPQSARGRTAD